MTKEYTREEGIAAIKQLDLLVGNQMNDEQAAAMWDKATPSLRQVIMVLLKLRHEHPEIKSKVDALELFANHEQDIPAIKRAMGKLKIPLGGLPVYSDGKDSYMIMDVIEDNMLVCKLEMGARGVESISRHSETMRVNPTQCNLALNLFDEECIRNDCLTLLEGKDCIARDLKPKQMCPSCLDYWSRQRQIDANKSQEVAP